MGRRVPVLWLPLIGFLLAAGLVAALGRDLDGRYAGSHSGVGLTNSKAVGGAAVRMPTAVS